MGLLLEAVDADGAWQWRWILRDSTTGVLLAEHRVNLDPESDEVTAYRNLYEYATWHESPDGWIADEERILRRVGAWAGESLLGAEVGAAIAAAAPVTVRVTAPGSLAHALLWPLELAHAAGRPLVERGDVAFAYDLVPGAAAPAAPRKRDAGRALRMLAVFSLGSGTGLAGIRQERYALSRLVQRVTANGRAVELRVLQYGVTRKLLAEVAGSGPGWDVLHLASHGHRGIFLLEKPDGSVDYVGTADLIKLLRPARRVKLAVVCSCLSAAEEPAAPSAPLDGPAPEADAAPSAAPHVVGLARGLVRDLHCAVVATRYQLSAEWMTAFNEVFYTRLLDAGDPVDMAAARAFTEHSALNDRPVYQGGLGIFGAQAIGLTLPVPRLPAPGQAGQGTPGLPGEPERFVGRTEVMSAAAVVLAARSKKTVVALHGMPGVGATTCALELAHRQRDNFAATAYWRVPGRDAGGPADTLAAFAAALHDKLDVPPPSRWSQGRWERYAWRLFLAMRDRRLLLVLDEVDALLGPDGACRDPRWTAILRALTTHGGRSRLILAGRVPPPVDSDDSHVIALGAFVDGETRAFLLELPALYALHWATGDREFEDRIRGGALVRAAAGHPGLLVLTDESAADPDALDDRLTQARGEIATWARSTVAAREPGERLMAEFVACLTAADRRADLVQDTWPRLWERLGRSGAPPRTGPLLDALAATTLIRRQDSELVMYPVVAAAARAAAARDVRDSADEVLAAHWQACAGSLSEPAWSAASALAYLRRQQAYGRAADLLAALTPDQLGSIGPSATPVLRQVAEETGSAAAQIALAVTLWQADHGHSAEVRRLLEAALSSARTDGNDRLAWVAAGFLVPVHLEAGRLQQALDLARIREGFARQADLGPTTQLAGLAQRLHVMQRLGQDTELLAEFDRLRPRLDRLTTDDADLTDPASPPELVTPWSVRLDVLDAARAAADNLGRWRQALSLSSEALDLKRRRGETGYPLAGWQRHCVRYLIKLGHLTQAAELLADAQAVVDEENDYAQMAAVLSLRSDLEDARGRPDVAADLERAALGLRYRRRLGSAAIAASHQRLGRLLGQAHGNREEEAAHRIAGLLIQKLARLGTDRADQDWVSALGRPGAGPPRPWTVDRVIQVTEQTDGVQLGDLLARVRPDPLARWAALRRLLTPRPDAEAMISDALGALARWLREG